MSEEFVSTQYLQDTAQLLQHLKAYTYACMNLRPGACALDIGCGPGVDTVAIAKLVAPDGRVFGVDTDEKMLQEADNCAAEAGVSEMVSHRLANVASLPFETEYFDACRAERLFQVLPAALPPQEILAEIIRVTKRGGRIVLADTDWGTASIDFPDYELERRLIRFFTEQVRPNGYAGRQFFRLCKILGLSDMTLQIFPILMTTFSESPLRDWLIREALAANIASEAETDHWKRLLDQREAAGEFYATANMIVVAAQKP